MATMETYFVSIYEVRNVLNYFYFLQFLTTARDVGICVLIGPVGLPHSALIGAGEGQVGVGRVLAAACSGLQA